MISTACQPTSVVARRNGPGRYWPPMPTRRQFDLVIIMLLLWSPAKALAKMAATRHSTVDTGISGEVARAATVIL